ncbi:MAG: plasmid partitioning protein RepA, partial [Mesorhizobium sp.]
MQNQNVSTAISSDARISHHARQLSMQLQLLRERLFPPSSQKMLKTFTSGEAAQIVGVSDGYLRQLSLDGKGPSPAVSPTGRRSYT